MNLTLLRVKNHFGNSKWWLLITIASIQSIIVGIIASKFSLQGFSLAEILAIGILWIMVLWPVVYGIISKTLDIFEPVHAIGFATWIYFGITPVFLILRDEFSISGVNYRPEFTVTLFYAALALMAFQVGYWRFKPRHITLPEWVVSPSVKAMQYTTLASLLFFIALVIAWVVLGRISLRTLNVFSPGVRYESWVEEIKLNQGVMLGYLFIGRQAMIPASFLVILYHKKFFRSVGVATLLAVTLLFMGLGWRHPILVIMIASMMLFYIRQDKRPPISLLLIVAFIYFYYAAGLLGYARTTITTSLSDTNYNITTAYDVTLASTGIAVPMAGVIRYVPDIVPWKYGLTLLKIFTQPIPRILWPSKPKFIGFEGLEYVLPRGAAIPVWGEFYINFGIIGIIISMWLWGIISKYFFLLYKKYSSSIPIQVWMAVYFPVSMKSYGRGDMASIISTYTLSYLFPILLPLLLARWFRKRS